MRDIDKKRFKLLERIEKEALFWFDKLERQFYTGLVKEFESILIIDGNKIESSTKNLVNLYKLGFYQDNFRKTNVVPFVQWMAKQLAVLVKFNHAYFDKDFDIKGIKSRIEKEVLSEMGVNVKGKIVRIQKYSYLDQLSRFENPYIGVRNIAASAINQGLTLDNFKKQLKQEITPNNKYGKIKHHLHTNGLDTFSRFDNNVQTKYAVGLGLRTFIYTGGTINSTRPVCRERNGKVYTNEEAEQWKNDEWDGKNKDYVPLRDLGGHRCRHFKGYIGKKEAIRRRPDLQEYFDALEN